MADGRRGASGVRLARQARQARQAVGRTLGALGRSSVRWPGRASRPAKPPARADRQSPVGAPYPGDFEGTPQLSYAPHPDDLADPGEIVWTWVPFEEDAGRGKDRPVLVIGRDGPWLLTLMLTSKDHDGDPAHAAHEAAAGRLWVDIGSGDWDPRHRPSEVRVDRIVRVDPGRVRRQGAVLDERRFDIVAGAVRSAAR